MYAVATNTISSKWHFGLKGRVHFVPGFSVHLSDFDFAKITVRSQCQQGGLCSSNSYLRGLWPTKKEKAPGEGSGARGVQRPSAVARLGVQTKGPPRPRLVLTFHLPLSASSFVRPVRFEPVRISVCISIS